MTSKADLKNLLAEHSRELQPGDDAIDAACDFVLELARWAAKINLTADRDPRDLLLRHVLDSWMALPLLPDRGELVDLGAGAGLPGIPIAIARPGLHVTLVESVGKKTAFMEHAARTLGLDGVRVVKDRIENLSRPAFDVACARALAKPPKAVESILSALRPGGMALLWTTPKHRSDHGLDAQKEIAYSLPGDKKTQRLILGIIKQA